MKSISGIYRLFEGRGAGGPTVTIHLPQRLAEDLLHVLHEAMEVAGSAMPDGEEELELDADEDELAGDGGELNFDAASEDDLMPAGMLGAEDEDDDEHPGHGGAEPDDDDDDEEDDEQDDDDDDEEEQEEGAYQAAGASQKGLADRQLEHRLARAYGIKSEAKRRRR